MICREWRVAEYRMRQTGPMLEIDMYSDTAEIRPRLAFVYDAQSGEFTMEPGMERCLTFARAAYRFCRQRNIPILEHEWELFAELHRGHRATDADIAHCITEIATGGAKLPYMGPAKRAKIKAAWEKAQAKERDGGTS